VSQYQKGKTNLDFTEARDSEWRWHQLGHMQVSTTLQTDNHASTPPLSFLQAGCPSCRPTNSVKALKALVIRLPLPYQECKTSQDLNEAKDDWVWGWLSCCISWTICKQSAPRSRQITTPTVQHFITEFLQAGCSS